MLPMRAARPGSATRCCSDLGTFLDLRFDVGNGGEFLGAIGDELAALDALLAHGGGPRRGVGVPGLDDFGVRERINH